MHNFALLCVVYGYHNLTTFGHEAGQIINLDTFTVCGIIPFFLIASIDGSQDTDLQDIKTLGKQYTFRVVKLLL